MLLAKAAASKPTPALRDDASLSSACFAANQGSSSQFSKIPSADPDASSGSCRNINVRNVQASAPSLEQLAAFTLSTSTEGHHQLVFLPLQHERMNKNQLFCSVTSLNTSAPGEDQPCAPQAPVCAGKQRGRRGSGSLHENQICPLQLASTCY